MVLHTYFNGLTIDSNKRYYIRLRDVPRQRSFHTLLHNFYENMAMGTLDLHPFYPTDEEFVLKEKYTYFASDSFQRQRSNTVNISTDKVEFYTESCAAVYFEIVNPEGEFYLRHNSGSYLSVDPTTGVAKFSNNPKEEKTLLRVNLLENNSTPPVVLIKLADNTNRFLTYDRDTNDDLGKFYDFKAIFKTPHKETEGGEHFRDTQFAIRLDTVFMGL